MFMVQVAVVVQDPMDLEARCQLVKSLWLVPVRLDVIGRHVHKTFQPQSAP